MHSIVRGALLAACISPSTAFAANASIASWFDQIPAPPETAAEAQTRVRIESGQAQVSDPQFAALRAKLDAYGDSLKAQGAQLEGDLSTASAGMVQDLSKAAGGDLTDPAFQAKLENMSDAEKMAFAMRMSGQSQTAMQKTYNGATYAGAEPAPVQAAIKASQAYQIAYAQRYTGGTTLAVLAPLDDLKNRHQQAHADLDASLDRDAMLCSAAGPLSETCLKKKSVACWSQHVDLAARQIQETQTVYQQQLTQARKDAGDADRALAPVQYGNAAKSLAGKVQLYSYQAQTLQPAETLLKASEAAWLNAAQWSLAAQQSQDGAVAPISGSCAFVALYGRSGSNGRSGTSRNNSKAGVATRAAQEGAKKVLNWLGR